MRTLVTGEQMKQIDQYTIKEIGIPSLVLMERAAECVVCEILTRIKPADRVWVACGTGNNGADGIAVARMLYLKGYAVTVILAGNLEHGTKECQTQYEIADRLGVNLVEYEDFIPGSCEVLVDAVFGVGLSREIEGEYRELLELMNRQNTKLRVAVDIPSGIHAGSGQILGVVFQADVTVTFGYEKTGMLLYPGRGFCGERIVADIGFPQISLGQTDAATYTLEEQDLELVPGRPAYSNKGTYGKVLIVAGSEGMSGAAYMSAKAAYRTGAGLVRILTVESNRTILQSQLPEAIVTTYTPEEVMDESTAFQTRLEELCQWASVIVLGPGLGSESYVEKLMEFILMNAYVPMVIDADGLNCIAQYQELTSYFTENIIITPHMGEMSRLVRQTIDEMKEQLIETARNYADTYGITCVLKDAATIIAGRDGKTYINQSGNSSMAKAGSGDVLTGVIAGLLALGMEEPEAAALGAYIHGRAGDKARELKGTHGVMAEDIIESIYMEAD